MGFSGKEILLSINQRRSKSCSIMVNTIFHNKKYKELEREISNCLVQHDFDLSSNRKISTRELGDYIENVIAQKFSSIISNTSIKCSDYSTNFTRKSMADLVFTSDNNIYTVDVTSHCKSTNFNMPNLISVKRLSKLYENDRNYFVIFFIQYTIEDKKVCIHKVSIFPIEFLSWECLTVGALGWGQIQIKNSNLVKITPCSRKQWILYLYNMLIDSFYPHELSKIKERQNYFSDIKKFWIKQLDI